jgi:hypothetical protein
MMPGIGEPQGSGVGCPIGRPRSKVASGDATEALA